MQISPSSQVVPAAVLVSWQPFVASHRFLRQSVSLELSQVTRFASSQEFVAVLQVNVVHWSPNGTQSASLLHGPQDDEIDVCEHSPAPHCQLARHALFDLGVQLFPLTGPSL